MLKEQFQDKRQKQRLFQSLFLSNGRTQEVMVIEDEYIDFGEVQRHLITVDSFHYKQKQSKVRLGNEGECKTRAKKKRNQTK